MISQAVQDYLKTIYKLQVGGPVSTTEIAKELKVSGASVTGMLKRLAGMGMVDYNSYKGVKLTSSGEKIALEIIRHHRLLELYLKEMLGFPLDKVHEEACRLEHYVSKEFVERITDILGNPEFDPHGHPIPTKDGEMPETDEISLVDIDAGRSVIISRLADNDPRMLAYFEELELMPYKELKLLEKAPFNGPITLRYDDKERIIGNEVAKNIFVRS
jgi:DtxR family Mn-dependent transcriptional regulator